ncbi:MAG: hypothetical protein DWH99_09325 [Planctomycetota bacterium]|nr:MAG: hypothetical protein DWH99_09325 [Planctomycetota bacterium]
MELGRPAKLDSKNAAKNWPQKLALGTGPGVLGASPGVLGTYPGRLGSREKCPKAKVGLIRIPVSVNFKAVESCPVEHRCSSGSAF